MTDPDRYRWHCTPLAHPGQALEIEYVRDAEWDRHWALVFQGVTCRQEFRRLASFTEARAVVNHLLTVLPARPKEIAA